MPGYTTTLFSNLGYYFPGSANDIVPSEPELGNAIKLFGAIIDHSQIDTGRFTSDVVSTPSFGEILVNVDEFEISYFDIQLVFEAEDNYDLKDYWTDYANPSDPPFQHVWVNVSASSITEETTNILTLPCVAVRGR